MKTRKRILSILVCLAMGASMIMIPAVSSASSASAQFDFDDCALNFNAKTATFTAGDGSTAEFMNGAAGTSVAVKNSDTVVPGNVSSNKFIKFDYNGDAGDEIASRLQITPAAPLTEDFVLEFDYALNRDGDPNGYAAYEGFMDITYFPNMVSDLGNLWKYGSKAVVLDQTYRVKTPKTNMITPEFWSGYTNYATGYVGNSGFATMKIVTRFVAGSYPVYDVYVKIPGASDFTKLVTGKQYADAGYGGASLSASDYNTNGFKYINIDMITGRQAGSRTSDRVLDAAIDNVRLYKYDYFPGVDLDFDDRTLNEDVKSATITASDGATAKFMNGASGTAVAVKNSDTVTPGNDSSNKFIKFDYNGDAGDEIASRLQITPASPLRQDFVLEFDYALNCVTGTHADYSPYEGFVDITFFPDMQNDSGNMWKYGSKAVVLDQTYRVKTPKTNMITPEFWSGYTNYATGYEGNSGFATMKIVTRFIENDYPVYDVYVKIPGASDFTSIVAGKQYAEAGYGGAAITANDYNNYGFKYINLDMITGRQAASRTADRVLDAAIDNIRIYSYALPEFDGNIDFEDDSVYRTLNRSYNSNKAATITYEDGTTISSLASVSYLDVTSSGFVQRNKSGNKYLAMEFKGSDYSTEATKLRFDFAEPFREDFTIEFKYAVDSNYPVSGTYTGANSKTYYNNGYTFVLNTNPDSSLRWDYASRLFFVDGTRTYARPGESTTTAAKGPESLGINNLSLGGFETIKIETKFHNDSVPTYSVYRKAEGNDYFECILKDASYSSQNYSKAVTFDSSYYSTNGIRQVGMDFVGDQKYEALSQDHYMKIALDDIKFYKTGSDEIKVQSVGVKDQSGNNITAGTAINGKTLYPNVSVANGFDSAKNVTVIVATYNANELMTGMEFHQVSLAANSVTTINNTQFSGIGVSQEGFVKLYIVDGLNSLNSLTNIFTSKR